MAYQAQAFTPRAGWPLFGAFDLGRVAPIARGSKPGGGFGRCCHLRIVRQKIAEKYGRASQDL